jgi:ribose transport system permease protein
MLTRPERLSPRSLAGAKVSGTTVILSATIVLSVIASFTVGNFASASNLRGLFLSVSLIGIVAVGLSLVTIVGKIFSLSIPALIALSTILFAHTLHFGSGVALLLAVLLGTAVGFAQGFVVGKLQTDPIITTIAASAIMVGLGQLWTNGRTIVGVGSANLFNSNLIGFIPFQTTVFVILTLLLFGWHANTVSGRKLTLIGLNEKAALISGLRSWPLVALAFTVSGASTGLAAGLLSAQSGQGTLLLGASFGFDAIVAVVVGGVGIKGGVGTPLGAAVGALFVGLVENVLALMGLNYQYQLVAKGVLVLAAVVAMGVAGDLRRAVR